MRAWWILALLVACGDSGSAAESVDGEPTAATATRPADPLRDAIEQHIARGLTERYEQIVDRVLCPPSAAGRMVCHAALGGGGWLAIDVDVGDPAAQTFVARERPVVLLDALASVITERYAVRGVEVEVDCGGRIRASRPGEIFVCRAAAAAGKTLLVTAIVTSTQGRVSLHYPD